MSTDEPYWKTFTYLFILYSNNSIAEGLRRSYNGSGFDFEFQLKMDNFCIKYVSTNCPILTGFTHETNST